MLADHLFSTTAALHVDAIHCDHDRIQIELSVAGITAACPKCAQCSARVHSHYTRKCADLPWGGRAVQIQLTVRRFFCDNPLCERTTFAEQVPEFLAPSARRTQRLTMAQRAVGLALGGEAGARLARLIQMTTSPDTLLRLIRASPESAIAPPRVLGIDDWAMRKGQTYGTILVDLEKACVIDLLPDRTPETVSAWLKRYPDIEVISRDRASGYAKAGTEGAPQAVQVADRFHLLMNLRETLERFFDRHQADLRKVRLDKPAKPEAPVVTAKAEEVAPVATISETISLSVAREARRQARFEEVRALKQQGWSRNRIARQMKMSANTVSRYLHADELLARQVPAARAGKAEAYATYLDQRWQAGCRQPRQLWREIHAQGFTGSESSVYRWVNHRRALGQLNTTANLAVNSSTSEPGAKGRVLSSRQAAWLLLHAPDELEDYEKDWLTRLKATCESVGQVHELAQRFQKLVKQRVATDLYGWIQAAKNCGLTDLRNFAMGLQRDYEAVSNALKLPWSNGPTEGQVHRLKMIKRQMYGRAKFDLLRKRVLQSG